MSVFSPFLLINCDRAISSTILLLYKPNTNIRNFHLYSNVSIDGSCISNKKKLFLIKCLRRRQKHFLLKKTSKASCIIACNETKKKAND